MGHSLVILIWEEDFIFNRQLLLFTDLALLVIQISCLLLFAPLFVTMIITRPTATAMEQALASIAILAKSIQLFILLF
jgi:hypothetical protein